MLSLVSGNTKAKAAEEILDNQQFIKPKMNTR
jgi:hypothetical protein